jgi:hypothetical protein
MATAETTTQKVTKTIETEEAAYVLTLSKEEASALRFVCARVGGSDKSPRGHFDSISRALGEVGAPALRTEREDPNHPACRKNTIYFKDFDPVEPLKIGDRVRVTASESF